MSVQLNRENKPDRKVIIREGKKLLNLLQKSLIENRSTVLCLGAASAAVGVAAYSDVDMSTCLTLDLYMPWIINFMVLISTNLTGLLQNAPYKTMAMSALNTASTNIKSPENIQAGLAYGASKYLDLYDYKQFIEEIEDFELATEILKELTKHAQTKLQNNTSVLRATKTITKSQKWIVMAKNATTGFRNALTYNSVMWFRNELQRMLILHISVVDTLKADMDTLPE